MINNTLSKQKILKKMNAKNKASLNLTDLPAPPAIRKSEIPSIKKHLIYIFSFVFLTAIILFFNKDNIINPNIDSEIKKTTVEMQLKTEREITKALIRLELKNQKLENMIKEQESKSNKLKMIIKEKLSAVTKEDYKKAVNFVKNKSMTAYENFIEKRKAKKLLKESKKTEK